MNDAITDQDQDAHAIEELNPRKNSVDEMDSHTPKSNSIQDEYKLLTNSIKSLENRNRELRQLLVRAKYMSLESPSGVDQARLEFYSARLMRARQMNVILSEKKGEAHENYFLWCKNQRNLAMRKVIIDLEEGLKKVQNSPRPNSPKAQSEKRSKVGIGNLFQSEDNTRQVKFEELYESDRRLELMTLSDPLSQYSASIGEIMEKNCAEIVARQQEYLNTIRMNNDIPMSNPVIFHSTPDSKFLNEKDSTNLKSRQRRSVSFSDSRQKGIEHVRPSGNNHHN